MNIVKNETREIILKMPLCDNNKTLDQALEIARATITEEGVTFDSITYYDYFNLDIQAD